MADEPSLEQIAYGAVRASDGLTAAVHAMVDLLIIKGVVSRGDAIEHFRKALTKFNDGTKTPQSTYPLENIIACLAHGPIDAGT